MKIISKQPNPSGAYPPIQDWYGETPPDTHYEVANGVELSYGGFGTLIFTDGIVTGFTPDETAWNAWKAANPEPTPQPTTDEVIRAQNATITLMASVIADLQADVEALQV